MRKISDRSVSDDFINAPIEEKKLQEEIRPADQDEADISLHVSERRERRERRRSGHGSKKTPAGFFEAAKEKAKGLALRIKELFRKKDHADTDEEQFNEETVFTGSETEVSEKTDDLNTSLVQDQLYPDEPAYRDDESFTEEEIPSNGKKPEKKKVSFLTKLRSFSIKDTALEIFNNVKKGNVRTIAALAAAVLVIGSIPVIISVAGRSKVPDDEIITLDDFQDIPTPTEWAEETVPSAVTVTTAPSPDSTKVLRLEPGMNDESVIELQQKLMELGYMDYDEPTDYYGPATTSAVKLFQKKNDLEVDGVAGEITLNLMFSENAKEYVATNGDSGTDIKELQIRLYELGYLEKKSEADGSFGDNTEAAVKKFQEKNGLTADGKIGWMTREKLYSEEVKANSYTLGDQSDAIKTYQQKLQKLGYLTTQPDGKYGKDTLAAVKRFQADNGIIVDGYIGPNTREILMSSSAQSSSFKIGDSGAQVTKIQEKLKKLGYMKKTTGYFGSDTDNAVKAFQKRNGLTIDGKVGPITLSKLNSNNAKKASGGSSGSSGGSRNSSGIDRLIAAAESKLGCPYILGAKGPNKFDCSGLAYWCINQAGIKQSYLTSYSWRSYSKYTRIKDIDNVRRGDIIIYKMSASKGHVAIAVSSSTMIDASSRNKKVVKRTFKTAYWRKVFYCAYRIF